MVVIGGGGFAGRAVCAAFAAAGHDVVAVSRRPGAVPGALSVALDPAGPDRFRLRELRPAVVVNAAGAVWGATPEEMRRAHVDLVHALVEVLSGTGTRLVHLGTVHEYGPARQGERISERTPVRPVGGYGVTKAESSRMVLAAAGRGELDAVVLRVGNAYGPGTPSGSLLGRVAEALAHGEELLELAPLTAQRDYVDVRDMAAAVLAAARCGPAGGEVVNIGRGVAIGVRELVELLVAVSGVPMRLAYRGGGDSPGGDAPWQEIDITRAARLLGWRPLRRPAESISALWRSYSAAVR